MFSNILLCRTSLKITRNMPEGYSVSISNENSLLARLRIDVRCGGGCTLPLHSSSSRQLKRYLDPLTHIAASTYLPAPKMKEKTKKKTGGS